MKEVHLTHLFLVTGGQNYKKMWKHSVVRFMTRKKINLAWKISDVYLGEYDIDISWDLHVISPSPLLQKKKHNWFRF